MKPYESLEMELIVFATEDIVTASGATGDINTPII